MTLTLEWLVNSSDIQDLLCVAGREHLKEPLSGVNVIDNCDVLHWVNLNEFAITTGYSFKDNPEAQIKLIKDLKKAGSAGLGLKINRFFDKTPERMIDIANEVGLPIIEIPYYYRFAQIANTVFAEMNRVELSHRSFSADLLKSLSELYFADAGLDKLLSALAQALDRICLIVHHREIRAAHIPASKLSLCGDDKAMEITETAFGKSDGEIGSYYSINGNIMEFVPFSLPKSMGYLMVGAPLEAYQQSAVEKVLHLFALQSEQLKAMTREVSAYNYYNAFYDMLMDENTRSFESLKALYGYYGFDYGKKRVCITVKLFSQYSVHSARITELITDYLNKEKTSCFICYHRDYINIFVYYPKNATVADAVWGCINIGNELFDLTNTALGCNDKKPACIVGVGRCHKRPETVAAAFRDSIDAVEMSSVSKASRKVYTYFSQIPFHVLSKLGTEQVTKLYHDSIHQLTTYDKANGSELVLTLRTYFSCRFNATETAKRLFLHRNTLTRRMEKIKEILRVDMLDTDELFSLYLALCAKDLLIID